MCYVAPKSRPFCEDFMGLITAFSSNPKDFFTMYKYTGFQHNPLSVKADGLARISNVNISYGQFSKHVCFLRLIWPNSFRNYFINQLKTTKYW